MVSHVKDMQHYMLRARAGLRRDRADNDMKDANWERSEPFVNSLRFRELKAEKDKFILTGLSGKTKGYGLRG